MSKGKLEENSGQQYNIDYYLDDTNRNKSLSKARIKTLEKELNKPHLIYDNIALTDNFLIALDEESSPNGAFTNIKYQDLLWIYIGDTGGFSAANLARVLSLAYDNRNEKASRIAAALQDSRGH